MRQSLQRRVFSRQAKRIEKLYYLIMDFYFKDKVNFYTSPSRFRKETQISEDYLIFFEEVGIC